MEYLFGEIEDVRHRRNRSLHGWRNYRLHATGVDRGTKNESATMFGWDKMKLSVFCVSVIMVDT